MEIFIRRWKIIIITFFHSNWTFLILPLHIFLLSFLIFFPNSRLKINFPFFLSNWKFMFLDCCCLYLWVVVKNPQMKWTKYIRKKGLRSQTSKMSLSFPPKVQNSHRTIIIFWNCFQFKEYVAGCCCLIQHVSFSILCVCVFVCDC